MDTVPEEQVDRVTKNPPGEDVALLSVPTTTAVQEVLDAQLSVRRPSAIVPLQPRRPSALVPISPAQVCLNQQRYMIELMQGVVTSRRNSKCGDGNEDCEVTEIPERGNHDRELGDDVLTTALSALYAKLLVVLGIAFPITVVLSEEVSQSFYQGFYLYLYLGSLIFMFFMYVALLKDRTVSKIIRQHSRSEKDYICRSDSCDSPIIRYGSFYLRLGAIGFGIGSMVYSGLEFGEYFELDRGAECSNVVMALTPATRMMLTLAQMQFIFLNSKNMKMDRHNVIAKFGLMHMIATNLCEWLYVLVEETKHEIVHLNDLDHSANTNQHSHGSGSVHDVPWNGTGPHGISHDIFECRRSNIMGSLVQNASPFLFPCTIEYSLICAVVLYEMWKNIKVTCDHLDEEEGDSGRVRHSGGGFGASVSSRSHHHLSVDCANAHKGLFAGILVLVLTIISLILFFVLNEDPLYKQLAVFEVNVCELVLYLLSTLAVLVCMVQMRSLRFQRSGGHCGGGLGLDNSLLVMAQTGMYIYCMFSIIGCYFTTEDNPAPGGLLTEIFSLVQTTCQTIFVLDASWRRCRTVNQKHRKPGRQIVTFLLVANMAMWSINTLEKSHAEFRPSHLNFFGVWAWTIITHVSMPLAIFYRFHSTICLFEIWKTSYKLKPEH